MSISKRPVEGKVMPGSKPSNGSGSAATGSGSRRLTSGKRRNGDQLDRGSAGAVAVGRKSASAINPAALQRNSSRKTAGNRQVTEKTVGGGKAPVTQSGCRRSPKVLGVGAIFVVLIVVLVLVLVGTNRGTPAQRSGSIRPLAPARLVAQVTSVPQSVFTKVGLPSEISNYPLKVNGLRPLTSKGLPEMLYMGAEYCPFCAAERWAMIMALSNFGTFSGLKTTYSSADDVAGPNTPTFSFYASKYTSKYLVFQPYELASNQLASSSAACNVDEYACLQIPPKSDLNLDNSLGGGSFPFMDFGNKLCQSGAGFGHQPVTLHGYTYDQIASQLYDPTSAVAQAEVGSANYLTAAICSMTGNRPGDVCSASYIKTAQKRAGIS
jgi:hypothetical protein